MKTKRFEEIDFARALPLLFLPVVHVYEEADIFALLNPQTLSGGRIFLYLCAFGPSVFMMILGMNIAFSSHTSPRELVRRGAITALIFYVHNILRYLLPSVLYYAVYGENEIPFALQSTVGSDILIFAALAFFFFALMKKYRVSPFAIIMIALGMLLVHELISPQTDWESTMLSAFIGCFVHVTEFSCFPALSWMIYPAVGYALGLAMKELPDEAARRSFYNKMGLVSLLGGAALAVCIRSYGLDLLKIAANPANDYITDFFNIALDMAVGGVWMWAAYYIYGAIRRREGLRRAVNAVSRSIMIFYLAQWILVVWGMALAFGSYLDSNALGFTPVLICSVVVTALSLLIAIPVQNRLDRKKAAGRAAV